jgi:malonyl CoA-acyl carrier protein transacylase
MQKLIDEDVDLFVEIGTGSTLQGLLKKIDKTKKRTGIQDKASLQKFKENYQN